MTFEGLEANVLFMFRPSSQDQKGLSDSNKFLTFLDCETLLVCSHNNTFIQEAIKSILILKGTFEPNLGPIAKKGPFAPNTLIYS